MKTIKRWIQKLDDTVEGMNKKWEFVFVTVLTLLIVFGVTIGMGTLTSGFHITDDHEFSKWYHLIHNQGESAWEIMKSETLINVRNRFIPVYYPLRMLTFFAFGLNMTAYATLKSIEVIFSIILLYYCARLMGSKKNYAYLFTLITWVGYQAPVWWKLGPQEVQCMLLFELGFFLMLKWIQSGRKGWAIGSLFPFLIMVNYKESFIILLPFIGLVALYMDLKKQTEKLSWKLLWQCICKRLWYYVLLIVIMVLPVAIFLSIKGAGSYSDVKIVGTSLELYTEVFSSALENDLKWFKLFGVLFVAILLTYWEQLKKLWMEMVLTLVFIIPQFILYGQMYLGERYLFPGTVAFAFFFVLVAGNWKPLSGKRRVAYVACIMLLLAAHGRVTLREADYYRWRGESVTTMLESVLEMSEDQYQVLSCLVPNEEAHQTLYYWMRCHDMDRVHFWSESEQLIIQGYETYRSGEGRDHPSDFADMDIIVTYNRQDRHWCIDPSVDLSDFTKYPCGTLDVYVRNNSGVEPVDIQVEPLRILF